MLNIIHTKVRHNCILNYDLYRKNIVVTPDCSCGKQEDAYHFSLFVKKTKKKQQQKTNSGAKYIMLGKLVAPVELSFVDTYTLLWGQEQLCYDINRKVFFPLFKNFICMSHRLTYLLY